MAEDEKNTSPLGRRAFLKLPLEERRQLLAEQAARLARLYEQDPEWRELEASDLIENEPEGN